mgnify:CR=1 FL=1
MGVYRKTKTPATQQVYLTPQDIKGRYTDWFDPCPHPRPVWDGLQVSWGEHAFCNPPWGNIRPWVEKALQERERENGCVVHMLLPPATSTATWHDLIFPQATRIIFLRRYTPYLRVSDGKTVAMPSCIVTFDGQTSGRPGGVSLIGPEAQDQTGKAEFLSMIAAGRSDQH